MGRREDRLRRKLEKNPAMECNKVRQKYCPDLFRDFANTKDPHNLSDTDYSNREMLGTMFYKGIAGITKFLPHGGTVNEYFARLDPEELQKVQQKQEGYDLIYLSKL